MKTIHPPKYVKRADQWVVTTVNQEKDKTSQTQEWFSTEEKALEYFKKYDN
mgnify:CR=1 FL=1